MQHPYYLVDAFCGTNAAGNPGAVFILDGEVTAEWMQAAAREAGTSETGFLRPLGGGAYALRWFSPIKEVPLCGHVTLCAAHVLWQECELQRNDISFVTKSGRLLARRVADGIEIDLPVNWCSSQPEPPWLRDALGIAPLEFLAGDRKYLVVVPTEEAVRGLRPDFRLLRAEADRGVIVTAPSDQATIDFVSRYFAAYVGVDEDPATGSAHCCLVPYWAGRLSKTFLRAQQLSHRGGEFAGELIGDRVRLIGKARTARRANSFWWPSDGHVNVDRREA